MEIRSIREFNSPQVTNIDDYFGTEQILALEDVTKLGSELLNLGGDAADSLEALKKLSVKSASLLKLMGPVGSLVSESINVAFKV